MSCKRTLSCLAHGQIVALLSLSSTGKAPRKAPVVDANLEEQDMLEAAVEVVAEMQLTADELKVSIVTLFR